MRENICEYISKRLISALFPLLLTFMAVSEIKAESVRVGHVEAELVAETESIVPGQPFWAALRINLDDHWHVYWRNPGDAGLPPKLTWHLPDGFTAEELEYPTPEIIITEPLVSFGYVGDVLYPVKITPPDDLTPGQNVTLSADVTWIVCEKVCIPGEAKLSLSLGVSDSQAKPDKIWSPRISDALSRLPGVGNDWSASFQSIGGSVRISFTPPTSFGPLSDNEIRFLPYEQGILSNATKQELRKTSTGFVLDIKQSEYLDNMPQSIDGILLFSTDESSEGNSKAIIVTALDSDAASTLAQTDDSSLLQILFFAFVGGLILNLMPCVLPVLSLKIMGFVNQAGEERSKIFAHGLIFTGGVLISFWILAGTLLVLRAGGEQLGWGFQLQSPIFLMILSGFMFLFGLSLLGVFEIGTSLTGVGGTASSKGGWIGSFVNGITATVVATPCTAPFMGSALGVALSQPPFVAMLIFSSLGLGMSAPYLVISGFPGLLRFVPKPGAWMETLKHIMGFLLLATVIWLGWVLSFQAGADGVVILMLTLLLLGIGSWVIGRWGSFSASPGKRRIAYVIAGIFVFGGMFGGIREVNLIDTPAAISSTADDGIQWEQFSVARVEELRIQGTPVFVDFTAAWCLSCKLNERVAFSSEEVQDKFASLGIAALKADWTLRDESITRALASYGRNSVPLYVLYGSDGNYTFLPEILTRGIVLDALEKIQINKTSESTARLTSSNESSTN